MEQLSREKNIFLIWRTQESEKIRLSETLYSFEYYSKYQSWTSKKDESEELKSALKELNERLRQQKEEVAQLDEEIQKKSRENGVHNDFL